MSSGSPPQETEAEKKKRLAKEAEAEKKKKEKEAAEEKKRQEKEVEAEKKKKEKEIEAEKKKIEKEKNVGFKKEQRKGVQASTIMCFQILLLWDVDIIQYSNVDHPNNQRFYKVF